MLVRMSAKRKKSDPRHTRIFADASALEKHEFMHAKSRCCMSHSSVDKASPVQQKKGAMLGIEPLTCGKKSLEQCQLSYMA